MSKENLQIYISSNYLKDVNKTILHVCEVTGYDDYKELFSSVFDGHVTPNDVIDELSYQLQQFLNK